jgi:hypothetical protein
LTFALRERGVPRVRWRTAGPLGARSHSL